MLAHLDDVPADWDRIVAHADADGRPMRIGRRSRRAVMAVAAASVAAAALVPTALLTSGSGVDATVESTGAAPQPGPTDGASPSRKEQLGTSDAARFLIRVSSVAAQQSHSRSGDIAYLKSRTVFSATGHSARPYTYLIPATRESWIAADGSGRIKEAREQPIFLSEHDRERWRADKVTLPEPGIVDRTFGSLKGWSEDLRLPTDPVALERALRDRGGGGGPEAALLIEISDLLAGPAPPAALRSALYAVLAGFDDVELLGNHRDPVGRAGVAISVLRPDRLMRTVLTIDPRTSSVLSWEAVLVKPVDDIGADLPVVINSVAYLESGWVESPKATSTS